MLARLSIPTLVLWLMFAGLIITVLLIGTQLGGAGVAGAVIGAAIVAIPVGFAFSHGDGANRSGAGSFDHRATA